MTGPLSPVLASLAMRYRAEADHARPYNAGAAHAWERAAALLDDALRIAADETLTLERAAEESGYSIDHLRHLIADGTIPQAGKKGAPRVRRAHLPTKPGTKPTTSYDPEQDALSLLRRRAS